jgi:hypothetical protein
MDKTDRSPFAELDQRLEKIYADVLREQGFTAETEKLRLIVELVKEQVGNEDSNHSTRETR